MRTKRIASLLCYLLLLGLTTGKKRVLFNVLKTITN